MNRALTLAELVETVTVYLSKTQCCEKVLQGTKVISGGDGNCLAEMQLRSEHMNVLGGLHGGLMATMVDAISTWALMTTERGAYGGGVSAGIQMCYMKNARAGDIVLFDAQATKIGKNLAFLEIKIKDKKNGRVIATGNHTKYIGCCQ